MTLREDWPEKRAVAEREIRAFVSRARAEGGRAIVVPFRVQGFGPYARVLAGLEYAADGRGLLPHPAVAEWIRVTADRLRHGPFDAPAATVGSAIAGAPAGAPDSLGLGGAAPNVSLVDANGKRCRLFDLRGTKATVLYFWTTRCPCVAAVEPRFQATMQRFAEKSSAVRFVAVDSDPRDAPETVVQAMTELGAKYPMLLDPKQELSASLGVSKAVTFVVLDESLRVRYRGALDDDLEEPKQRYLVAALDAVLAGRLPQIAETEGQGCPYP
jgi:peroxiredoxin